MTLRVGPNVVMIVILVVLAGLMALGYDDALHRILEGIVIAWLGYNGYQVRKQRRGK